MEQAKQATILVVDDDEASRKLLEALLAAEGHAVRTADSGAAALTAVAAQLPDLIRGQRRNQKVEISDYCRKGATDQSDNASALNMMISISSMISSWRSAL